MRRAHRVDTTQESIVRGLRTVGARVTDLSMVGAGVPDLLVSYRGNWHVLEVKGPKGELTPDQVEWWNRQEAPVHIVRDLDEALAIIHKKRIKLQFGQS